MVDRMTSPVTRLRGREETGESDVRRVRQSRRTDVLTLTLSRQTGEEFGEARDLTYSDLHGGGSTAGCAWGTILFRHRGSWISSWWVTGPSP